MESTKFTSVEQYIKNFPKEIQEKLEEMRAIIKKTVPEAEETIAYNMPAYKVNGKAVAYYSAAQHHLGFYPFPSGVEEFKRLSDDFITTKGGIQIPYEKAIPKDLVIKVLKYRVEENRKKAGSSY